MSRISNSLSTQRLLTSVKCTLAKQYEQPVQIGTFFFLVQANREDERDKKFLRRVNHSPPQSSSRYSRDSRCVHLPVLI